MDEIEYAKYVTYQLSENLALVVDALQLARKSIEKINKRLDVIEKRQTLLENKFDGFVDRLENT